MDKKLLQILVCPQTGGRLEYHEDAQELWSHAAKLAYPIIDDAPVMLPSEARSLTDAQMHGEHKDG